ncbi:toxin-antitoxin system YwqK family antitoxin [Elizabethkingia anophelis]|uniref:toxin-antitoxin system YwqK family antitoxin n=1 Tax=Elizabethkingia anophelis TaxID=1117645 RepID=UPI00389283FE
METLRVKEEDLEFIDIDGGGTPIYHYQGKPFTGMLLEYYDNILYREIEYINGYEDGVERVFYENGKVKNEFQSKNNKLNGICKDWDEEGNLISTTEWKDGVKIK